MPYAIIRAGGHQEKVTPGEQITVDRLKQAEGEEITFVPLLVSKGDDDVVSDKDSLAKAKVVAKVVQHLKGDKVDIFMYRNKTGYRRHTGHRQPLTLVEITSIEVGGETFNAPPPEEKPAGEPKAEKPKKAPEKKSAAKKAPAKKSAAKK